MCVYVRVQGLLQISKYSIQQQVLEKKNPSSSHFFSAFFSFSQERRRRKCWCSDSNCKTFLPTSLARSLFCCWTKITTQPTVYLVVIAKERTQKSTYLMQVLVCSSTLNPPPQTSRQSSSRVLLSFKKHLIDLFLSITVATRINSFLSLQLIHFFHFTFSLTLKSKHVHFFSYYTYILVVNFLFLASLINCNFLIHTRCNIACNNMQCTSACCMCTYLSLCR